MKLDKYRKYNNDGIDSENDFFLRNSENDLEAMTIATVVII